MLELLSQAIGSVVEAAGGLGGLQIALLPLILGLLIRARKVAVSVGIGVGVGVGVVGEALLCAPDLLLARLIGVYGLGKCGRRGGEWPARVLVLEPFLGAEAKVEIQAVALLLLLLLVVHCGGWSSEEPSDGCLGERMS